MEDLLQPALAARSKENASRAASKDQFIVSYRFANARAFRASQIDKMQLRRLACETIRVSTLLLFKVECKNRM